jgi:hypothetical protein
MTNTNNSLFPRLANQPATKESCNKLISWILTAYSATAYMEISEQNNLDFVPNQITKLWYDSSEHPSIASIKRPTSNTDCEQLFKDLLWLDDQLCEAFANLL